MSEIPPADAGHKKTLLVVDDAPANIQVVQSILKDEYKIRVATSGEKALELVKSQPLPDLILLDVMMPGLDGYQVCERLKAAPETRDIPVIFLTGLTDVGDETKGLEVGAARLHPQTVFSGHRESASADSAFDSRLPRAGEPPGAGGQQ